MIFMFNNNIKKQKITFREGKNMYRVMNGYIMHEDEAIITLRYGNMDYYINKKMITNIE